MDKGGAKAICGGYTKTQKQLEKNSELCIFKKYYSN
jgi:hypothetical protein